MSESIGVNPGVGGVTTPTSWAGGLGEWQGVVGSQRGREILLCFDAQ